MSFRESSVGGARERAMVGVLAAGVVAWALVLVAVARLGGDQVIGVPTAAFLGAAYLAMCMYCTERCFSTAWSADYVQLAPLAVFSVGAILATVGILIRMALGGTGTAASAQQLAVAVGLTACLGVVGVVSRIGLSKATSWVLTLLVLALAGAEVAARPTGHLVGPAGGYPTNWAEPFLFVVLLGWIAYVLTTERVGRIPVSQPVCLALAPAAWLVTFALTHDLASEALLAGALTAWHSAEPWATRPFASVSRNLLIIAVVIGGVWILSWGMVFDDFSGLHQLLFGAGPSTTLRYRLAHLVDPASGSTVRFLVPLNPGAVVGLVIGLATAFAVIIGALWWIARGIDDLWAGTWARGLTAFLAAQCVLAFVGLLPGPAEGFPAPFLSASVVWDGADALAVAIVIGLAVGRPRAQGRRRKSPMELGTGGE